MKFPLATRGVCIGICARLPIWNTRSAFGEKAPKEGPRQQLKIFQNHFDALIMESIEERGGEAALVLGGIASAHVTSTRAITRMGCKVVTGACGRSE